MKVTKFFVHLTIEGTIETEGPEEGQSIRLPLDENLGMQLKLAKVARRLTLQQLSQMSGVSTSHIGRIEKGERIPSSRIVGKLERALGEEVTLSTTVS